MPSYRGTTQADLINVIDNALKLLEKHSPGSETQKYIDDLRKPDASGQSKLDAIASAKNDAELVKAVRGSGVTWLFNRASEIFRFHAAGNTDKKGYDILKGLVSSGFTGGVMTMEYNKFDAEFGRYLKK